MNFQILFFSFFVISNLIAAQDSLNTYNLIQITKNGARCIDGTYPGIYFQPGTEQDHYLIYFEGGGLCQGSTLEEILADCVTRSQSDLGSSKNWNQTQELTAILSGDPSQNYQFFNWNKIYVPYCDGLYHSGYRKDPYIYNGTQLYFRGHNNTRAIFDYLINELGMKSAKKVVVSGGSSGAIATLKWSDYLRNILNDNIKLYAAPDAGIFLTLVSDQDFRKAEQLYIDHFWSSPELVLPVTCKYRYDKEQAYKCDDSMVQAYSIQVPMLLINSKYDSYQMQWAINLECMQGWKQSLKDCNKTEVAAALQYGDFTAGNLTQLLKDKDNMSVWMISCIIHTITDGDTFSSSDWQVPMRSNQSIQNVLYQWISRNDVQPTQVVVMDQVEYPGNSPCSGLNTRFLQN